MGYKFKVGDKVRIRKFADMRAEFGSDEEGTIRPGHGNPVFRRTMAHLCGQVATITQLYSNTVEDKRVSLKFDDPKGDIYWHYAEYMLEPAAMGAVVIYQKDYKTVVAQNKVTGQTGIALCCPTDEFDFNVGARIAFGRLMGDDITAALAMSRPKNIQVGDRVVVVNDGENYAAYASWIKKHVDNDYLLFKFEYGGTCKRGESYVVKYLAPHDLGNKILAYIQGDDEKCHLIGVDGLKRKD